MAFHVGEKSPLTPSLTSYLLRVILVMLIVNSVLEIGFASASAIWLRGLQHRVFHFFAYGSRHHLAGLPASFIVNHVNTSIAAAVSGLMMGAWGLVALWMRNLTQYRTGAFAKYSRYGYYLWVSANVPSLVLTVVAIIYVFTVSKVKTGHRIDTQLAVELNGAPYTRDTWTPQTWLAAVLKLKLLRDREDISDQLKLMEGWQFNNIPCE
ncbi:hypothetical protein EKO27_g8153 [Xylaria grammica]|uniref:Uncharacterized protein n=1 Tax=Xylaria grammica TaxID=363999 RepID=A0A439CXM2_9PEZI|nr:hypothetical protein EKO27_g8153 [Xylaria grammica]